MNKTQFTGLVAAAVTPFHADGSLNLEPIEPLAELFIENELAGVFVCGTTGESLSLTVDERKQIAERWIAVCRGKLPVIVHAGHNALPDARALAAHAQRHGAQAIGVMAPSFFRPDSMSVLIDYCAEVAAAAPETPFYYYHLPGQTGVNLPVTEFLRQAPERIPTLTGAKFSNFDLAQFQQCARMDGGRFDLLIGSDEILLAALAMGAQGAIGSTYNFAAPLYREIIRFYLAGDLVTAQALQEQAVQMIEILRRHGPISAGKAVMKFMGIDCGPVRLPLRNLTGSELEALRRDLEQFEIFSRPFVTII